eukprot:5280008-Pyramimonas_sp.AAC.1
MYVFKSTHSVGTLTTGRMKGASRHSSYVRVQVDSLVGHADNGPHERRITTLVLSCEYLLEVIKALTGGIVDSLGGHAVDIGVADDGQHNRVLKHHLQHGREGRAEALAV